MKGKQLIFKKTDSSTWGDNVAGQQHASWKAVYDGQLVGIFHPWSDEIDSRRTNYGTPTAWKHAVKMQYENTTDGGQGNGNNDGTSSTGNALHDNVRRVRRGHRQKCLSH
jgi:hypothetical protein